MVSNANATMLTAIVNANKELVNLHKIKQDAAPHGSSAADGGGVNIEKAVFVGRAVIGNYITDPTVLQVLHRPRCR